MRTGSGQKKHNYYIIFSMTIILSSTYSPLYATNFAKTAQILVKAEQLKTPQIPRFLIYVALKQQFHLCHRKKFERLTIHRLED